MVNIKFYILILSIDEMASLHEGLMEPVRLLFNTSGLLYYAWVLPYGIAVVIFVLSYLNFLNHLPKQIMILFLVSGGLFISGAIGMELIGGRYADLYGTRHLTYSIIYTFEELLEMLGVATFIYALLLYITNQFTDLKITLTK